MLNSISKLVKFISSRFLLFILGIFLATGATYVYATWTSPTLAPPEGNIAALINTSNTGQAKQGGLILNTGGSANGLIVQFGNVGIGTTSPGAKLVVVGNIIADAPTASNHLATMGYVDAASGVRLLAIVRCMMIVMVMDLLRILVIVMKVVPLVI